MRNYIGYATLAAAALAHVSSRKYAESAKAEDQTAETIRAEAPVSAAAETVETRQQRRARERRQAKKDRDAVFVRVKPK